MALRKLTETYGVYGRYPQSHPLRNIEIEGTQCDTKLGNRANIVITFDPEMTRRRKRFAGMGFSMLVVLKALNGYTAFNFEPLGVNWLDQTGTPRTLWAQSNALLVKNSSLAA